MTPTKEAPPARPWRVLAIVFAVILLIVVSCVVTLLVRVARLSRTGQAGVARGDLCQSKDCVVTAAQVLTAMNQTVNPCVDFYQYACGGWMQGNPSFGYVTSVRNFRFMRQNLGRVLARLFSEPRVGEHPAVRLAKTFYRSCVNDSATSDRGLEPFLKRFYLLKQLAMDTSLVRRDLAKFLVQLHRLTLTVLIHVHVKRDMASPKNVLYLQQPSLTLDRHEFLDEDFPRTKKAYARMMTKAMKKIAGEDWASGGRATKVVELEARLANITVPPVDLRKLSMKYSPTTLEKLGSTYPAFDWSTFLRGILRNAGLEVSLPAEEKIIVGQKPYFDKLFPLLGETPEQTVVDFVLWSFVVDQASALPSAMRKLLRAFTAQILGRQNTSPTRAFTCIGITTNLMPHAVSKLYINTTFSPATLSAAAEVVNRTVGVFIASLGAGWMTAPTRSLAVHKAKSMNIDIGFSKEQTSDAYLNAYYQGVVLADDEYFDNYVTLWEHGTNRQLASLRSSPSHGWHSSAVSVNAFYSHTHNTIMLPAGILQPPSFSLEESEAFNYAFLGFVVGHEITHGFDNVGRHFDSDGYLSDWWQHEDAEIFRKKTECMVHQYSQYKDEDLGIHMSGQLTLGDNIADNGGLKTAFQAFMQYLRKRHLQDKPVRHPGLQNLTQAQLFFLAYAQSWCSADTPGQRYKQIHNNQHSLSHFRVLGTLRNSKDFARAYACPLASPMNPEHKCAVW